jgi:hypothetical protein
VYHKSRRFWRITWRLFALHFGCILPGWYAVIQFFQSVGERFLTKPAKRESIGLKPQGRRKNAGLFRGINTNP